MQIINRDANIKKDICYRITPKSKICDVSNDVALKFTSSFEELKKEGKSISNIDDLSRSSELIKQRHLAKMRILKKEQSGGYVLVGTLTCIGTFLVGMTIFMAIKFMLMK